MKCLQTNNQAQEPPRSPEYMCLRKEEKFSFKAHKCITGDTFLDMASLGIYMSQAK